jgi:Lrp/AsnC family transcriptional regulator for asnA, asnC and gidA
MDRIELDHLDREIIRILQYDGRMPYTHIADQVGVTEGTVRRRVSQLLDSGIMQVVAVVEPQYLGWGAAAMVGVSAQGGMIDSVANRIAQFPEVSYLFMASGEFDLFVEVYCQDRETFVSFLSDKLQQIPGVRQTRTFMILKMYKLSYRWGEAMVPSEREVS